MELSQIEQRAIIYILDNKDFDFIIDENLTVDYFDQCADEYNFIADFVTKYGRVPDKSTFFENFTDFEYFDIEDISKEALINSLKINHLTTSSVRAINNYVKEQNTKYTTTIDGRIYDSVFNLYSTLGDILVANQSMKYTRYSDIADLLFDKYKDLQDNFSKHFYPTGIEFLTTQINGWNKDSDYVVVGGRTGTGKSMMLCNFATKSFKEGLNVAYYSGEMSIDQVMTRIISCLSGISSRSIMTGDENIEYDYKKFLDGLYEEYPVGSINILTPEDLGNRYANVNNLEAFCRKCKADILYIDQQSLMTDLNNAKVSFERAANISRQIKALRDKLNIPIICAVQLNRTKVENGVDTTQIAGSDVIGQDATKVIILEKVKSENNADPKRIEMTIAKNRDGLADAHAVFDVNFDICQFNFSSVNFESEEETEEDPYGDWVTD